MASNGTRVTDQAAVLRDLVASHKKNPAKVEGMRSLAVVSGKGGVGKSNISVNLAVALGEAGLRTAILDADLGLANVDLLFGVVPKYHMGHVIKGERSLDEIMIPVNDMVSFIPGGAGIQYLADMDEQQQSGLIEKLSALEKHIDILVIDTGAGINRNVISFAVAVDQIVLVTTTEPTAIRDCYGVLKSLASTVGGKFDVGLVVNMAGSEDEAVMVAGRISTAAMQFLNMAVPFTGYILWDKAVSDAVKQRKPFIVCEPDSMASACIRDVVAKLLGSSDSARGGRGVKSFLFRLAKRMQSR